MRPIEKVNLIGKIAILLQEQMTYSQIDIFLAAFGINCRDYEPSVNSKRVYVEELLGFEQQSIISQIALDLDIDIINISRNTELATFWEQGYFKLFISHLAKHKIKATELQNALRQYGISGFVAHVDIKPSKEWQEEIEKALHTMDALTAILMKGFKESNWCDQEIGFAVGKDVLIIPIRKELDPYGFIGKYQAIQGNNTTVQEVAKSIFETIIKHSKTRNNMLTVLSNLVANSTHETMALKQLKIISRIDDIPKEILEQMSEQINNNAVLMQSKDFLNKLHELFNKYNIPLFNVTYNNAIEITEDMPF